MSETRRRFSPQEKVSILRRLLLDKVPISALDEEYHLHPNQVYDWQRQLFENGAAAFQRDRSDSEVRKLRNQNDTLQQKLARKDAVLGELLEEHIALKKLLGRPRRSLGRTGQARRGG